MALVSQAKAGSGNSIPSSGKLEEAGYSADGSGFLSAVTDGYSNLHEFARLGDHANPETTVLDLLPTLMRQNSFDPYHEFHQQPQRRLSVSCDASMGTWPADPKRKIFEAFQNLGRARDVLCDGKELGAYGWSKLSED
jgi:hypothetical protein